MKNKMIYIMISVLLLSLLFITYFNQDTKKFQGKKNTYQTIEYHDVQKLQENGEVIIVDVRSFLEYQTGHINDALNISLDKMIGNNDLTTLFPNKKASYVIYCRSGNRSKTASEILLQNGYDYVYDLGGIEDYHGPIVKGDGK